MPTPEYRCLSSRTCYGSLLSSQATQLHPKATVLTPLRMLTAPLCHPGQAAGRKLSPRALALSTPLFSTAGVLRQFLSSPASQHRARTVFLSLGAIDIWTGSGAWGCPEHCEMLAASAALAHWMLAIPPPW